MTPTPKIVSKSLKHLFDAHGRVNARAIAETLGVPVAIVAHALRLKPNTVCKRPSTAAVQPLGQHLAALLNELVICCDEDLQVALIWMRKPQEELNGFTPLDVLGKGRLDVLARLIHATDIRRTEASREALEPVARP